MIAVVVGGMSALGAFVTAWMALAPIGVPMGEAALRAGMWAPAGVYGFGAASLIWLGVGVLRARRWARALTLVLSWIWLLIASLIVVITVAMAAAGELPGLAAREKIFIAMAFTVGAIFFVGMPLGFILVLRRAEVRQTFEELDPVTRWTDRRPLAVLGTSVFLVGVLAILLALAAGGAPLAHLAGSSATLGYLMLAVLVGVCAVGLWRGLAITLFVTGALYLAMAGSIGAEIWRSSAKWPLAIFVPVTLSGVVFLARLYRHVRSDQRQSLP